MPEQKKKTFPENFYWGEEVLGALPQEVASYFELVKNSDNLNSICKMQRQHI
jgi:hypothetical protein